MPFVFVNHKVADFDSWKPIYDSDQDRRESLDIQEVNLFRGVEDPNEVHILFEVPDIEKMKALLADPMMAEKMQEAGVLGEPSVTLLNKA